MSVVIVEIFQHLPVPLKGMQILWKLAGKPYEAIDDFGGEKRCSNLHFPYARFVRRT
jgi:hypothetical protein